MDSLDLLILADLHYVGPGGTARPLPERKGKLALELALRAVRDALRAGRPDAMVLMGDTVERGSAATAREDLAAVRDALAEFGIPLLAVPGNHDGDSGIVAQIFDCRLGIHELGGYALVIFADQYDAEDVCTRPAEAMKLLESARARGKPVIVLQHPPVIPRIESDYPYTISGAEEIAAGYAAAGVTLSVSGHYHEGLGPHQAGGVTYLTCPVLCEAPFRYARVRLEGRQVASAETISLAPAEMARLFDAHMHTEFAYCAAGTRIEPALERVRLLGMPAAGITEHADQLYFPEEGFWGRTDASDINAVRRAVADGHARHAAYRERAFPLRSNRVFLALECDAEVGGRGLAVLDEDLEGYDYLIGAIHYLAKGYDESVPAEEIHRRFMARTEQLAKSNVNVLAHPFRYFPRNNRPVPAELFRPVAELLAAHSVAAEMNFHHNQPDPEFFAICLELGVRISVGSDAHSLEDVGALRPHLELLKEIGALERLDDVLWRPPARGR